MSLQINIKILRLQANYPKFGELPEAMKSILRLKRALGREA